MMLTRRHLVGSGLTVGAAIAMPSIVRAVDSIAYGVMSTFSGPGAPWGAAMGASAKLAADEINRDGGIKLGSGNVTIRLLTYDHAYDPTKAVSLARQAVFQDKVRLLDVQGGAMIPIVQTITEPQHTLLIGAGGGEKWVAKDKRFTFKSYFDIGRSSGLIMKHIRSVNPIAKKIVLLYPDDDVGEAAAETAIPAGTELGFEVIKFFVSRETTDYYPLFSKLLTSPPDYIDFGGMPGPQYATVVKQAVENGYVGKFMFSSTIDLPSFRSLGAEPLLAGSFTAPAWTNWPTDRGQRWMAAIDKRYPGQAWTALSYDMLYMFKAAAEAAGSTDADAVRNQLEKVKIDGATGNGVNFVDHRLQTPLPVGECKLTKDNKIEISIVAQ